MVPAVVGLVLVACGDDDGGSSGGGDAAAFCAVVTEAAGAPDLESEEGVAAFRELAGSAPSEIRDDIDIVLDAVERLDALDEDDPASIDAAFEIALDPQVIEATENLEMYSVDECGLDPNAFDDADIDRDAITDDRISTDGMQAYLADTVPDAEWVDDVFGWTVLRGTEITISGSNLEDDALEACGLILSYAGPIDAAANVTITDLDENVLAVGTVDDGCSTP